jgi:glycosyltransferase involved in cell wall biosynthesis
MRILVINWRCPKNPLAGGAEIYLHEICRRLVSRGCQITLLAERFPGSSAEDELDGVRIIRRGNKWSKWTFNWTVYRQLNAIVREGEFELVIDDLNKIPFYSPWITDRPVLVLLMHLFRTSVFQEVPAPLAAYVYLAESLIPFAYRKCRFAVLSESSRQDVVRLGIPAQNITVVPPGTDFERYHPAPVVQREPIILHVGRLKKYKSTDHLLYAARRLKDKGRNFQVVIVGSGDDRPRLEKIVAKLALADRVQFTGYITEAEKIRLYQRSTVLVENSVKEGWGLIVIEANACGTPVVVARSPGLVDSSRDGVNGFFYDYGNIEQLTEKLDLLLTDQELCRRLGNQAIDWAKQWTWEGAVDKIYNLILGTLHGKPER